MIFIRGLKEGYIPPESLTEFQKEWENRENSHPDFQYSENRLEQLEIDEQRRNELMTEAFDRMNAHWNKKGYIRTPRNDRHYICPKCGKRYDVYAPIEYCTKCGSQLVEKPKRLSRREVKAFLKTVAPQESIVQTESTTNTKEKVISEGQFHFEKSEGEYTNTEKSRRHFPVRKIVGAILAIIIVGALVWYAQPIISFIASHVTFPSQSNNQPIWNTETFQLVQASLFAPVVITRHFELQIGNHLVGNFQFSSLPTSNYAIGVGILDPLQGALQAFLNETSGSFDITASISGAYEMNFAFTCTQQVTAPSVTLNTRIVR